MRKLFLAVIMLFTCVVYADDSVLLEKEKAFKESVARNVSARSGRNVTVNMERLKKVEHSDFYIYRLIFSDDSGQKNEQLILFNGYYVADDFSVNFTSSVLMDYEFETSNVKIDFSKLTLAQGNPKARNVIIEVTDFECPYCKNAFQYLHQKAKDKKDVAVYIAHLPLTQIHPKADLYARIFEAGMLQKQNFAEELFLSKEIVPMNEEAVLKHFSAKVKKPSKFMKDVESDAVKAKVKAGTNIAQEHKIQSTPVIFINNKRVDGFNIRYIDKAMENIK